MTTVPEQTGKMHWHHGPASSDKLAPGDNIMIKWGQFGNVVVRVIKVYEDGFSAARWNKRRQCWTTSRRFRAYDGRWEMFR